MSDNFLPPINTNNLQNLKQTTSDSLYNKKNCDDRLSLKQENNRLIEQLNGLKNKKIKKNDVIEDADVKDVIDLNCQNKLTSRRGSAVLDGNKKKRKDVSHVKHLKTQISKLKQENATIRCSLGITDGTSDIITPDFAFNNITSDVRCGDSSIFVLRNRLKEVINALSEVKSEAVALTNVSDNQRSFIQSLDETEKTISLIKHAASVAATEIRNQTRQIRDLRDTDTAAMRHLHRQADLIREKLKFLDAEESFFLLVNSKKLNEEPERLKNINKSTQKKAQIVFFAKSDAPIPPMTSFNIYPDEDYTFGYNSFPINSENFREHKYDALMLQEQLKVLESVEKKLNEKLSSAISALHSCTASTSKETKIKSEIILQREEIALLRERVNALRL